MKVEKIKANGEKVTRFKPPKYNCLACESDGVSRCFFFYDEYPHIGSECDDFRLLKYSRNN